MVPQTGKTRKGEEIISLILKVARRDERIRAVLLNGSRANPLIEPDQFQDFDIVYFVNDINTFVKNHSWIDVFGERLILQMPDAMVIGEQENKSNSFAYLMIFKDGNRIDLTLFPLEKFTTDFEQDSLTVLLLDKDGLFLNLPPSSDSDYHITKPTQKLFTDCCNEFWWVCTNVAKGLWRQEIVYAMDMLDMHVRPMLMQLVKWQVGSDTNFSVSFGKSGKNIQSLVSPALYNKMLLTYPTADIENIWGSLFIMSRLFSELANKVSNELGFEYNLEEDNNVSGYLKWVYKLTVGT